MAITAIPKKSNDIAEIDPREAAQQRREMLFQMPSVNIGLPVVWYSSGQRNPKESTVGFVRAISNRNIRIFLATGETKDSVPHIDDPRLQRNEHHREFGAWDFTDDHKLLVLLKVRVEALEKAATGTNQPPAKPTKPSPDPKAS